MENREILSQMVCLRLEYHLFTGRKKLKVKDLKDVDESQIPPRALASLGSKQICDKDEIQKFNTVFRRAERLCEEHATPLLGCLWATTENRMMLLTGELDKCVDEVGKLARSFATRFETIRKAWQDRYPEWRNILDRDDVLPKDIVKRFSLSYHVGQVSALNGSFANGLDKAVKGLSHSLFDELTSTAAKMYKESIEGRDVVQQSLIARLGRLRDKLDELSFIDTRMNPIIRHIDQSIDAMPKTGSIKGNELNALLGLVSLLMSRERVLAFADTQLRRPRKETVAAVTPVSPARGREEQSFILLS